MAKIHRGNIESTKFLLENYHLLSKEDKVLEIGSGTGYLCNYLREQGYNVMPSEVDDRQIKMARELFGIKIKKMKGEEIDYTDNAFDKVISFDVFEHIPDSDMHLSEVRRVLKPGGTYILQTPNKYTNLVFEFIKNRSFTKHRSYHVSLHSKRELVARFDKHGFDIEFKQVPVVNDFFIAKLRKYMGSLGPLLVKVVNPDKFPSNLQTNFHVVATLRA